MDKDKDIGFKDEDKDREGDKRNSRQRKSEFSREVSFSRRRHQKNARVKTLTDEMFRTRIGTTGLGRFLNVKASFMTPVGQFTINCSSVLNLISILIDRVSKARPKIFQQGLDVHAVKQAYANVVTGLIAIRIRKARQHASCPFHAFDYIFEDHVQDLEYLIRMKPKLPACLHHYVEHIGFFTSATDCRKQFVPIPHGFSKNDRSEEFGEVITDHELWRLNDLLYLYPSTRLIANGNPNVISNIVDILGRYGAVSGGVINQIDATSFTAMSYTDAILTIGIFEDRSQGVKFLNFKPYDLDGFSGSRGQMSYFKNDSVVATTLETVTPAEVQAGSVLYAPRYREFILHRETYPQESVELTTYSTERLTDDEVIMKLVYSDFDA